jgi:hypothetical protein
VSSRLKYGKLIATQATDRSEKGELRQVRMGQAGHYCPAVDQAAAPSSLSLYPNDLTDRIALLSMGSFCLIRRT